MSLSPSPRRPLRQMLSQHFCSCMSGPLFTSFVAVVEALLELATATRGWYGRLSQGDIARAMCTKGSAKVRYKRLGRFLSNARLDCTRAVRGLSSFGGINSWGDAAPVLVDQTSLCGNQVQAIVGSFPFGNRAIPVAFETFATEAAAGSQNQREWRLLERLIDALAGVARLVLVMDRGYAKSFLIGRLLSRKVMFLIRACRNVIIEYHDNGPRRVSLGRLRHRQGVPVRYRNVKYLEGGRLRVDIIVFRGRGFAEPWFIIVPPDSEEAMPTERAVEWYRWRMCIEVSFRDFKSCLGVRKGLRFVVDPPGKMARMLICLAVAYIVLLGLSQTAQARRTRKNMEVRRRTPRHGTRRTLSVLTVAVLTIIDTVRALHSDLSQLIELLTQHWTCGVFSPSLDTIQTR